MKQKNKKYRNPLRKAILRDIGTNGIKNLTIVLFIILMVSFISGIYISNTSMMAEFKETKTKYNREDGHFELKKEADKELLSAIEKGEKADVKTHFLNKAYKEADEEVYKKAEQELQIQVKKTVRETAKTKIYNTAKLKALSMGLPEVMAESVAKKAVEENLDKTVKENYKSALNIAKDSKEFKNKLNEALEKAHKEVNDKINEKYSEISERFSLDDKSFEKTPVTLYQNFYKNVDEDIGADGKKNADIRVYKIRTDINTACIMCGRLPESANEIAIDRMHADNNKIKLNSILKVGNKSFTVVGFVALPDYSTLYKKNSDTMFDALTFNLGILTPEGFDSINEETVFCYSWKYKNSPSDITTEKKYADDFLKALITQNYITDNEIKDYIPEYANQGIQFSFKDFGSDLAMVKYLFLIIMFILAFIFSINISNNITKDASVIGTLRASGYTKYEILKHYMAVPVLLTFFSDIVGNTLGYTVFKKIVIKLYYNSYSLPTFKTRFSLEAFSYTTLIPIIMLMLINIIFISYKLRLPPLKFLRHDLKSGKQKVKTTKLPDMKFFARFRMRILTQNFANYIVLTLGIFFIMLILSMGLGLPYTLSHYQNNIDKTMLAPHQYILSDYRDKDGNPIETNNPDAEKYSMKTLLKKSDKRDEDIPVYGIEKNSKYIKGITEISKGEVVISDIYAKKANIKTGDKITLSEKYENKNYEFTVKNIIICERMAVFTSDDNYKNTFNEKPNSFTGYFSENEISDFPDNITISQITKEDLSKMVKQLDHSMGNYMKYFQVLCILLSAALMFLLTKIIIEKNENSISMVKILGYKNSEINSLYLIPTFFVVITSELITAFAALKLMHYIWWAMMQDMEGYFDFVFSANCVIKMLFFVFLSYIFAMIFDLIQIKKIPLEKALKNSE